MNEDRVYEFRALELIVEMINNSSIETKKRVNEKLKSRMEEFHDNPIGVITECLKEVQLEVDQELKALGTKIEEIDSTTDNTAKTLNNMRRLERGKALTEALSSRAREQQEEIQQRRNEMYEKMIEEAGEIESPTNRLHH